VIYNLFLEPSPLTLSQWERGRGEGLEYSLNLMTLGAREGLVLK